jgi:hypothetical protein
MTKLVNVRLDEKRLAKARRLRANGIALSDLVRNAIDEEYEKLARSSRGRDVEAIMKQIYEQHPDPVGLPRRDYDVHDRAEARIAILNKLRHKRK